MVKNLDNPRPFTYYRMSWGWIVDKILVIEDTKKYQKPHWAPRITEEFSPPDEKETANASYACHTAISTNLFRSGVRTDGWTA